MQNYIWVVEMWNIDKQRWETTVGIGLTKKDVLEEKQTWNYNNPNNMFRIRKYVSI